MAVAAVDLKVQKEDGLKPLVRDPADMDQALDEAIHDAMSLVEADLDYETARAADEPDYWEEKVAAALKDGSRGQVSDPPKKERATALYNLGVRLFAYSRAKSQLRHMDEAEKALSEAEGIALKCEDYQLAGHARRVGALLILEAGAAQSPPRGDLARQAVNDFAVANSWFVNADDEEGQAWARLGEGVARLLQARIEENEEVLEEGVRACMEAAGRFDDRREAKGSGEARFAAGMAALSWGAQSPLREDLLRRSGELLEKSASDFAARGIKGREAASYMNRGVALTLLGHVTGSTACYQEADGVFVAAEQAYRDARPSLQDGVRRAEENRKALQELIQFQIGRSLQELALESCHGLSDGESGQGAAPTLKGAHEALIRASDVFLALKLYEDYAGCLASAAAVHGRIGREVGSTSHRDEAAALGERVVALFRYLRDEVNLAKAESLQGPIVRGEVDVAAGLVKFDNTTQSVAVLQSTTGSTEGRGTEEIPEGADATPTPGALRETDFAQASAAELLEAVPDDLMPPGWSARRRELMAQAASAFPPPDTRDFSGATLDELVATLEEGSSLVPAGLPQRLGELVQEARAGMRGPREGRTLESIEQRQEFVRKVNAVLDWYSQRFELPDGRLARLQVMKAGTIRFGVPGDNESFSLAFKVVPVRHEGRALTVAGKEANSPPAAT